MVSIPRDTRTEIVGKGTTDKINHAYAFGGVDMAVNTVEKFLDVPVDYYVQVNMESFKDIVDAVGGVTVNNDLNFDYDGYSFKKESLRLMEKKLLLTHVCVNKILAETLDVKCVSVKLSKELLKKEQAFNLLLITVQF